MKLLLATIIVTVSLIGPVQADITQPPDHTFLWNNLGSIRVIDSFAVVTSDFGIASLKLNPVTGQFDPLNQLLLGTPPTGVEVGGDIAVVRSMADVSYFIDLSNLPELTLLGEVDLGASVYDLAIRGDDLYLACGFQGLRQYRLTDYSAPEFIDSSLAGIHCVQVDVSGSDLIVLDDYNGILRYDLDGSGIDAPVDVLFIPRRAESLFLFGDTLILPLVDHPLIYRGIFGASGGELLDSLTLTVSPEAVFAIDTLIIAVDTDNAIMELIRGPNSRLHVILNENLGLLPVGDTHFWQGTAYLTLMSGHHGLASYNLPNIWFNDIPRQAYGRPGPITSLCFSNDHLATGGERNPLESYRIDPDGKPVFDTALYGLNNVGDVVDAGGVLIAHFPTIGLLSAVRFDEDSIHTFSSIQASQIPSTRLKYFDYEPVDSLGMVLSIGHTSVDIIAVSEDWQLRRVSTAHYGAEILDAIVLDSFLVFTTADRQIYSFHIFRDFGNTVWAWDSAPGLISHLVETGPREADDGSWWQPSIVLGFDGNEMYELYLSDPYGFYGYPVVLPLATLPVEVTNTALGGDALYTIGSQGLGRLDLSFLTPVMDAYGGFGGDLIAYGDSTLVTSDGTAIHLYSYKNATSTAPAGEASPLATYQYLRPNYPNPFNPVTRIDFYVPQPMRIELEVFNLLGRKVTTLLDEQMTTGLHTVEWDGTDRHGRPAATGVYFYRLSAPTGIETRKMVLLK